MNRIIVPITAGVSAVICAVVVTLFARGQGLGNSSAAAADLSPIAIITATPREQQAQDASAVASASSTSIPQSSSTTISQPSSGELRTYSAGDGGTATFGFDGKTVTLESANPNAGWEVFIDDEGPREIELDFISGSRRLRLNAEVEDGALRVRLEERKTSNDDSDRSDDDDSDSSDDDDDSSGSNRGRDHDEDD